MASDSSYDEEACSVQALSDGEGSASDDSFESHLQEVKKVKSTRSKKVPAKLRENGQVEVLPGNSE